jgi:magnesium chelatase family protein
MGFARVYSAQPIFLDAALISVEADLSMGLQSFQVVGLGDRAIDESRERVAAAIKNSGFESPKHTNKRTLISLAPANLKKEGPRFDLPIALSYLIATESISFDTSGVIFLGELSLEGDLRPVQGVLSIARFAHTHGYHTIVVPMENAAEAALIHGLQVLPAHTLRNVVSHFSKQNNGIQKISLQPQEPTLLQPTKLFTGTDFNDIRGQELAKRGLEIAASGRHNIILYGPPGTGKTLLARALQDILPPLSFEEALETTAIHSLAGQLSNMLVANPPFRAPHHSASYAAIVGGGSIPHPGEATLAHRGVLFLDEFPEFERRVIDGLREPLEDRVISISRAKGSVTFPANFILVAAMNPTRERGEIQLNELDRERLKKKISGPIVDRIDLWIEVSHIEHAKLQTQMIPDEPLSPKIREQVINARTIQTKRYGASTKTNSDMTIRDIDTLATLTSQAEHVLTLSSARYNLSPRSYHRIIKLARTIADLAYSESILEEHVLEALTYRPKGLFN